MSAAKVAPVWYRPFCEVCKQQSDVIEVHVLYISLVSILQHSSSLTLCYAM